MIQHKGFTLVELMIGLSVMALVLAFGIPGFQNSAANANIRGCAIDLVSSLNTARAEAVNNRVPVHLFALGNDGNGNVTQQDNEWAEGGWRLDYQDVGNNIPDIEFLDCVSNTTKVDAIPDVNGLIFGQDGFVKELGTNAPVDMRFVICDDRPDEVGRTIRVNRFGRLENDRHPTPDNVCNP